MIKSENKTTGNYLPSKTGLAALLLDKLGKSNPSKKELDAVELLLSGNFINQKILFDNRLTPREIDCLFLAAIGKTSHESAQFLEISHSTVETHRKEIKRKLNCKNIAQAVFEGIRYGYFNPRRLEETA